MGISMRSLKWLATFAAMAFGLASAQAGPIDIGPAIGTTAPALAATDAGGTAQSLRSVSAKNGTVLVFFRSAAWCPFCQRQLQELKTAAAPLAARGYKLAAISYDPPATLAAFAAKQSINYVLLSDAGSKTIDAYALRDPQYPAGSFAYGVPRPAIFVIDAKGVVRAKLAEDGYRNRPPVEAILAAVDGLKAK